MSQTLPSNQTADTSGVVVDKIKRRFDPEKFAVNAAGSPRFDKIGRFVNKRAGRKGMPKSPQPDPAPSPAQPENPPEQPQDEPAAVIDFSDIERAARPSVPTTEEAHNFDVSKLEGSKTCETIIGAIQTALVLIGDDEGLLSETEKMVLRMPLERVLKKYDVGEDVLPPEFDLALAMAGVVIVRLQKPKTATFAAKVKHWVVNKWFRHKGNSLSREIAREAPVSVGVTNAL
jgi:hypothetical protein